MILFAALLYVVTVVGGFGSPICARSILMDVSSWQFSNNPPNSASVANAMKCIIILNSTCTGTFTGVIACIFVLEFVHSKKYPPVLLRASASDI